MGMAYGGRFYWCTCLLVSWIFIVTSEMEFIAYW
jgi:hypothetical protein